MFDASSHPPVEAQAQRTGIVWACVPQAFVRQGDGFAFVGEPITRKALLSELAATGDPE